MRLWRGPDGSVPKRHRFRFVCPPLFLSFFHQKRAPKVASERVRYPCRSAAARVGLCTRCCNLRLLFVLFSAPLSFDQKGPGQNKWSKLTRFHTFSRGAHNVKMDKTYLMQNAAVLRSIHSLPSTLSRLLPLSAVLFRSRFLRPEPHAGGGGHSFPFPVFSRTWYALGPDARIPTSASEP